MGSRKEYYDKVYSGLHGDNRVTLNKIRRVVDFEARKLKILDIGCGPGAVSGPLVELGHEVYGLDISDASVREAHEKGIKAQLCDVEEEELPFSEGEFDLVMALDVLEHVFNPTVVLEKMKRVVKKDGALLVCFPNHFDLINRLRILLGFGIVHWHHRNTRVWEYFHIRFPTLAEVREWIGANGLFIHKLQINSSVPRILRPFFPKPLMWVCLRASGALFSSKFMILAKPEPAAREELIIVTDPVGF
ncbi:MAG: class I SAM-dependent methyltransferase [Actinobacteria bacterium]|nr:class I SAM-dependent methyltransferase [Actinomycetota bacterium]